MGDSRSRKIPAGEFGWVRPTLISGTERDVVRHSGDWWERVNQFVIPSRPFFRRLLEYGVADPFQYPDLTVEVACSPEMRTRWVLSRLGKVLDWGPIQTDVEGSDDPRLVWKATLWQVLQWLEAQYLPGTAEESRAFGKAIESVVAKSWPMVHKAWREVVADGVRLTGPEVEQLKTALDNRALPHLLHKKLFKETDDPSRILAE